MLFSDMGMEHKEFLVKRWKGMDKAHQNHFINQVALTLSVCGSDLDGRKVVVDVLHELVKDGSGNLSDFGIYLGKLLDERRFNGMTVKAKRASNIVEGYRMKHDLPSEPHKAMF
ncbi:MAG: hypothetical protein ACP5NX_02795 [Candidatus Bilamarchaeaceae archaeon]